MMFSNSLVDVTRALQLESAHIGSVVLARADGSLAGVVGSASRTIFPRSAVKIIQAVPTIECGAAERFRFSDEELALICASHNGGSYHVALAEGLLQRFECGAEVLACGGHLPLGMEEQHAFLRGGGEVSPLQNNCSGKHAGMVATARHLGEAVADYEFANHGVQRRIRRVMEEVTDTDLSGVLPGVDGCSAPNWPVPLDKLAVGFARIVGGTGFAAARHATFERLLQACWAHPQAMAGPSRFETRVLERFKGDVFIKLGAEGVCCGGSRSAGIGFALKVDDGAGRAAEVATRAILARLVAGAEDLAEPEILHNAAGIAVGDVRAGQALMSVLERMTVAGR